MSSFLFDILLKINKVTNLDFIFNCMYKSKLTFSTCFKNSDIFHFTLLLICLYVRVLILIAFIIIAYLFYNSFKKSALL